MPATESATINHGPGGRPHFVDIGIRAPEAYAEVAGRAAIDNLRLLAEPLRGKRVLHLNATSYGGGVSELLRSLVPLLRGLGIEAEWRVIAADAPFFRVTKLLHNGLQGSTTELTPEDRDIYLSSNRGNSSFLEPPYDFVFVHDPQPAAVHHFIPTLGKHWIWRCHIDTSEPNPNAWEFLRPFVEEYDAGVFTMRQFVPRDLHLPAIGIIRPAIDPLSPKNMAIPEGLAQGIMEWAGVRTDRPVMTQVSRFDPWKDPLGVVEVFRRVRSEVPDLQLALLGSMALDDPEGWDMYRTVLEETEGEPEIHVLTNLTGISDVEVNAFQTLSDVVVQKSIREGFGLVVSEAAWKGTPVVAGRAGGIPLQIPPANQDLLVDDVPSCVERILALLRDPGRARVRGAVGRKWTRTQFLLPRLAADDLQLMRRLLGLTDSLEGAPPEEA